MAIDRDAANEIALRRMCEAEPVLVDVRPAIDAIPGMSSDLILTSGPQIPFDQYTGGQRKAVVYGALYEGLADDYETAEALCAKGEIRVGACHDYGCVGSVAGIYSASMPVFVVENRTRGNI